MRLETVRTALEQQLRSPATDHTFRAARARHAALADFDGPDEAITFLNSRGPDGCQRRSAVTAAMIAEAQRRETGTWSALLMLAYFPGLLGIRSTMKPSAGLGADELNAQLVESFLETVWARCPPRRSASSPSSTSPTERARPRGSTSPARRRALSGRSRCLSTPACIRSRPPRMSPAAQRLAAHLPRSLRSRLLGQPRREHRAHGDCLLEHQMARHKGLRRSRRLAVAGIRARRDLSEPLEPRPWMVST